MFILIIKLSYCIEKKLTKKLKSLIVAKYKNLRDESR